MVLAWGIDMIVQDDFFYAISSQLVIDFSKE